MTYAWLWDVDMDAADFEALLAGDAPGRAPGLDADWALLRLVEYAPYRELRRLLPRARFLARWPAVAGRVRSAARREGMDYMFAWLNRREGAAHE